MARARIKIDSPADLAAALGRKLHHRVVVTPGGKERTVAPKPVPFEPGSYSAKADGEQVFDSPEEERFANWLEEQLLAGEIKRWDYQPERFRLGRGDAENPKSDAWYMPDFRVIALDDAIEFHEVKGHVRDADVKRLKVVASLHPYRFKQWQLRPKKEGGGFVVTWDSHAK